MTKRDVGALQGEDGGLGEGPPLGSGLGDVSFGDHAWLRRRLEDQEQLLRRSLQQSRELGDAVVQLAKAQGRRQTWANLNSFVAYLLFTLLLGFGAYVLFHTRMAGVIAERDQLRVARDESRLRGETLQEQLAARQAAGETALAFYGLVKAGKRADVVAKYRDLPHEALTPTERALFDAAYRESQAAIIDSGMSSAIAAFRAGNIAGAVSDLTRLLQANPDPTRLAQIRYYLGMARMRSGQHADAIAEFAKAIEAGAASAGMTDVVYQYASALEGAGQLADAKAQYEAFVAAWPAHALSWPARRKVRALERGMVASSTTLTRGPSTAPAAIGMPPKSTAAPAAAKPWMPRLPVKKSPSSSGQP